MHLFYSPYSLHSIFTFFPTRRSSDLAVRPVQFLAGGHALPAGRARVFPRRQEGQAADRVRAAHRPRRPPFLPSREYPRPADRKSTRLNSSHVAISYAVFCLKKKKKKY